MNRHAIDDIQRAHKGHWFDASSMRFFKSRVSSDAYRTADGAYSFFVSSERFDYSPQYPRMFSVRRYTWATDNLETIGQFQAYAYRDTAQRAARYYAAKGVPAESLVNA